MIGLLLVTTAGLVDLDADAVFPPLEVTAVDSGVVVVSEVVVPLLLPSKLPSP